MSVYRFSTPVISALVMSILAVGAEAALFHPASFPATTAFNSVPGAYEINTDALQMIGPGGFSSPGVLSNGAAVFSFTNFLLGNGATITTTGDRPAAILSQSDMIVAGGGVIARAAGGLRGGPSQRGRGQGGGFPGSGFFGGAGGGGGYGGPGGRGQLDDFSNPGAGGPAYGDISTFFLGGSGGGGSSSGSVAASSSGGDGGGAIELGAVDFMLIAGNGVRAEGLSGSGTGFEGGGGGSGGGIRLHANQIINTTTISAAGGRGGVGTFENGGGGGGGRILITFGSGGFLDLGTTTARGGFGGSSFFGAGTPGTDGVITIVPEPATAIHLLTGLAAALATAARLRRRSALAGTTPTGAAITSAI